MLIGASVLCFLVLMAVVADRYGSRFWHGGANSTFYRCEACDLRYLRRELDDPRRRVCPQGHPIDEKHPASTAGLITIFVCVGFLVAAVLLVVTGIVPVGP